MEQYIQCCMPMRAGVNAAGLSTLQVFRFAVDRRQRGSWTKRCQMLPLQVCQAVLAIADGNCSKHILLCELVQKLLVHIRAVLIRVRKLPSSLC